MKEVENRHNMIVMEALGHGMGGNIASSVTAKLKGIAGAVGDWARGRIRPEVKIPLVAYNAVIKDLAGSRFSDVSSTKITTPRGLKGPLPAYVESLFDALVKVENVEEEVLKPFNIWLSLRLAAPDTLASAATVTDLKNFKEQDIEGTRAALKKFVDPTGRVDALPLQQVYDNLSAIKPTWDNANALAIRYLETNPSKIVKLVQEIAGKIDRVIVAIEEGRDESGPKLSAQTATILSGICMNMSYAIDLYGQIGILIRELVVSCDHQVAELKKPLAESRKISMKTESLVIANEAQFVFGGTSMPHSFVAQELTYAASQAIAASELAWVFEFMHRDPLIGSDVRQWAEDTVGAVRIGEKLYPITNLDLLAAQVNSGIETISCNVVSVEDLIKSFTRQDYMPSMAVPSY